VTAHGVVTGIEAEEAGDKLKLDIWMENQRQTKIVVGEASCIQ